MRLEHPIFHEPLDPDLELVSLDTPGNYRIYVPDLPAKLTGWQVHTGEFGSNGQGCDVGMVSDPYGFEDSPDAEWISGGVNSKGPDSVALGRHGNVFHWGFYGAPDRLTHGGKAVFLNTLVYMTRFDGMSIQVPKRNRARDWCLKNVGFLREYGEQNPDMVERLVPATVREAVGVEPDVLERYYRENFEYLYLHSNGQWLVDEDLKSLGVSNRAPEFLTMLLARFVLDAEDPVARRLAARYLPDAGVDGPEELARYLADHGRELFFTDVGGCRWLVEDRRSTKAQASQSP